MRYAIQCSVLYITWWVTIVFDKQQYITRIELFLSMLVLVEFSIIMEKQF